MDSSSISSLPGRIRRKISGEVLSDPVSRSIYSTDASLYQITPLAVVLPRDRDDAAAAVSLAAEDGVPIVPRGAGTSLAGQTVGPGIVIDFSKYMNRILELNKGDRYVTVQPGVVLDQLNEYLAPDGFFFAPDVATSSRATVGGMMGNNSSGVRSIRYGKTVDHVLRLSTLLSCGNAFEFLRLDPSDLRSRCQQQDREGEIYRGIREIVSRNRSLIQERFPKVMRRVSGYNLDELLDEDNFNLARLFVGSEGTLGVVTQAQLNIEPIPKARMLAVLHFNRLMEAIQAVPSLLEFDPSAVEILDHYGLALARDNPVVSRLCQEFLQGDPDAVLFVEFSDGNPDSLRRRLDELRSDERVSRQVFHLHEAWEAQAQQRIWQVRKNALGVMLGIKGDFKPLPFIEDSCVPVQHLADYVAEIQEICRKHNRQLALYAHASVGVIHLRPLLNLHQDEDLRILSAISEETFQLVRKYKGSWSGEHGDGLVRSYKLREFFGDQLYEALCEVKRLIDPKGIMNPGKIVDPPPMTENLRIHPAYRTSYPQTYYRFSEEGGFDRAIEMCTGVGQCRKLNGIMCPSYLATRDEEHSTRGRANALRAAISGQLGPEGFTSERLYGALDLCLECKACKSECPSSVDMAKMKSEFLAHYYERHGLPLNKRLIAGTRTMAELAVKLPSTVNWVMARSATRHLLEAFAGLDRRRRLPAYAKISFERWYHRNYRPPSRPRGRVTLFADTFTNFYEPEAGIGAIRVLSALGLEVELFTAGCCGRPLLSAGQLGQARRQGNRLVERLERLEGAIIVLEPSCFATLRDDYPDLLEDAERTKQVVGRIVTLEEYLALPSLRGELARLLKPSPGRLLFHGHCQQKAIIGSESTLSLLNTIPGVRIDEVPAGCCGMAGAFGYQKRHYELSEKIGSQHLFPAVREAPTDSLLVIPGFSCRAQVRHFAGREALHHAVLLSRCLAQSTTGTISP